MNEQLNRYPGAKPFLLEEKDVFHGRKKDIEVLFDLLRIKRMVTLYSESGIGKSSLINAGLIPKFKSLRDGEKFIPIKIRFGLCHTHESTDERVLLSKMFDELKQYKKLLTINDLGVFVENIEYNLWCQLKLFERNGFRVLLIFDQLEEVFSYRNDQINEFKEQIHSIFSGIPALVNQAITREIEKVEDNDLGGSHCLELDEKLRFINSPLSTFVLFVVREEKLGYFNIFMDYFPNILKDIYKLSTLTYDGAKDAIELPANLKGNFKTMPFNFTASAIDEFLSRLAEKNGSYDPFTIQLACRYVEKKLVQDSSKKEIGVRDIPAIGVIEKDFIDNVWKALPPNYSRKIDYYKDKISEKLIEPEKKRRISVHESDWIPEEVVTTLIKEGLLKRDRRGEEDYLELSHDRLVHPMLEDYNARKHNHQSKLRKVAMSIGLIIIFVTLYLFVSYSNLEALRMKDKVATLQIAVNTLDKDMIKHDNNSSSRYLDSALKTATASNYNLVKIYLDSAESASINANNEEKLDTIAQLREKLLPASINNSYESSKVSKIDVFYDERTLPQSEKTADYIVGRLKADKSLTVRKRLLTITRINLNKNSWDISRNVVRYEKNKTEVDFADSLVSILNISPHLTGEQRFHKQSVSEKYKSPNYISIFIKN